MLNERSDVVWPEPAWNDTAMAYPDGVLPTLISAVAARDPERVAVRYGDRALTAAELEIASNRLAHHLVHLGVGPDVLVAVCLDRSERLLVTLLAVLKAGGAYVPLDPTYPAERIALVLEDAAPAVLVTESLVAGGLPPFSGPIVIIDRDNAAVAAQPATAPAIATTAEHLAYVIFTSGSTGRPKGVQISHRALVNFLATMAIEPGFAPGEVLVAVTTVSFDIAGLELYLPLVVGGTVVIAPRATTTDPAALASLLDTSGATVLQATPATWRMLVDHGWGGRPGLRAFCGGEALPQMLAKALIDRVDELWNLYGPTETTIWSTVSRIADADAPPTIGRPIGNTTVYITDAELRPVPVGEVGDLYLGGHGLARGYHGRPDLTAERFLPSPFPDSLSDRLYATGDVARFRPDGTIDYLGRSDFQVKIRGFRVELGEVEAALEHHPTVGAAVVVARDDELAGAHLVGYVVPKPGQPTDSGELRRYVRDTLPAYMVPSVVVRLDSFPLTPNGKVDRKALPEPPAVRPDIEHERVLPRTALEDQLRVLWEETLGISPIGVTDDVFDLGATSMVVARLITRVSDEFAADLPLAPLFEAPTIEQLAALIEAGTSGRPRFQCLVPIQPNGSRPPIFCVHGGTGSIPHLKPLARRLAPADQPFYGIQAKGLYGDAGPDGSVEAMATSYLIEVRSVQPHGPYRLAGYCFGGLVAYEMAAQLLAAGEQVELLAGFNAVSPSYLVEHGMTWSRHYGQSNPNLPGLDGVDAGAVRGLDEAPEDWSDDAPDEGERPARPTVVGFVTRPARRARRILGIRKRAWQRAHWIDSRVKAGQPVPDSERERFFVVMCNVIERRYRPVPLPVPMHVYWAEGLYDEASLGWSGLASSTTSVMVPGWHKTQTDAVLEPGVGVIADDLIRLVDDLERSRLQRNPL